MIFPPRALVGSVFLFAIVCLAAPGRWAAEIDQLTASDSGRPPPPGAVVFVGSSSIRLWSSLAEDFPGVATVNRGFGGSELADSTFYADRIVIPYRPRTVVLYAGDNDIWAGKTAEAVAADFRAFRAKVHAALPETRILFLSIKPSPSRWRVVSEQRKANRLIAADCATDPRCAFVDVATPLLDANGDPKPEFYAADQLHLSPAGYAAWTKALAPFLRP